MSAMAIWQQLTGQRRGSTSGVPDHPDVVALGVRKEKQLVVEAVADLSVYLTWVVIVEAAKGKTVV